MLHVTSWRKLKVFKWRMGGTQYCSEQCIKSPSEYSTRFIKFRVVVTSLLRVTKASWLARDKYQGMFKIQLPCFANCLGAEQVPKSLHSLLARGCSFQSRRRGELCQSSDPPRGCQWHTAAKDLVAVECALRPRIRYWGRPGDYAAWLLPDSKIPTALVGSVWMCHSSHGTGPRLQELSPIGHWWVSSRTQDCCHVINLSVSTEFGCLSDNS